MGCAYNKAISVYMCGSLPCIIGLYIIWRFFFASIGPRLLFVISILFITTLSVPFMSCVSGVFLSNPCVSFFTWLKPYSTTTISPHKVFLMTKNSTGEQCLFIYLPGRAPQSRCVDAQWVYKQLNTLSNAHTKTQNLLYIVSPESFFPYPLKEGQREWVVWSSILPTQTSWVFGGTFENAAQHNQQVLFSLQKGPIIQRYEKEIVVDWFEGIPQNYLGRVLGHSFSGENLFVPGRSCMQKGEFGVPARPLLCIELCIKPAVKSQEGIWLFCNEMWLPDWVRALWKGYGIWYAWRYNIPLVWIGHSECFCTGFTITEPLEV
jgi:hypothetical protein